MTITTKTVRLNCEGEPHPTIVQILPALVRGGVERGTIEVAEAIQRHGGQAVVISSGGPLVHQLERCGARHHQLNVHSKNPMRWPSLGRQLRKVLRAENASLVHVRSRVPAWISLPVAQKMGLARVSTVHGRFVANSVAKRFYNRKMLDVDHVIAISNYVQDLITSQYDDVEPRVSVIQRGVDIEYFNPSAVNHTRIINFADSVSLREDLPVVMLPSRATAWKGQKILLEALARLPHRNFMCLLVGAGDGKSAFVGELTEYGKGLGLEGVFRLTPLVSDMPAALMFADVVVMPSITPEPFGRVALEAQAMGRPVIAFNHGGAVESIIDHRTGWLVPPCDVDALSAALGTALSLSRSKRRAMALAARAHIEVNFSTELMCQKTLAIYRQLLDRQRAEKRG
jgi:glycosyltransferase involved in cell wall biosynthesis